MSSKFFGNSKLKVTQRDKNKKGPTQRANKRPIAIRKTGRGK
tara:strand:+ start:2527 stop:2652 length:126 start_codon:yes stop_codon:yes gene_type:complete